MVPKGDGTSRALLPSFLQQKMLMLQTRGNLLMEVMQAAQSLQLNNPASAAAPSPSYSYWCSHG